MSVVSFPGGDRPRRSPIAERFIASAEEQGALAVIESTIPSARPAIAVELFRSGAPRDVLDPVLLYMWETDRHGLAEALSEDDEEFTLFAEALKRAGIRGGMPPI
jgi:hypothetical protein